MNKISFSLLLMSLPLLFLFLCCEKHEETETGNSTSTIETWQCIGQKYEYIGDGTDSISDPAGNTAYRLVSDSMFIVAIDVFPEKNIFYSNVEKIDSADFNLFFKDRMWYSYSFPATYGYPVFVLSGIGSDSSSIAPIKPTYNFKILKQNTDTLSFCYNYSGVGPFNKNNDPHDYYMFTKIGNRP